MVNLLGRKSTKTYCLPTSFAHSFAHHIFELRLQLENLKSNDNFKQLYCGCGYGPFTNNKGIYTNLLKNYRCYIIYYVCITLFLAHTYIYLYMYIYVYIMYIYVYYCNLYNLTIVNI